MENIITKIKISEVAVFTVCNLAYLPRALVLAESLARYDNISLRIVLFDKKVVLGDFSSVADILWIEDLGVPNLDQMAFMYDIIEFSTSLKPFISLKFLKVSKAVIFLDPDTCLFDSLFPILEDLNNYPIVLTPHYTTPQPNNPSESDLGMMRFGSFNLGFFAVNSSLEAKRFLEWWSVRCIDYSLMESQFGLSTDQKWVAIAPCFFPGIHVSFNLGYNAAPWNTFERTLSKVGNERYEINKTFPLVFFHFSNFDYSDTQYLNKRASSEIGVSYPVLKKIGDEYAAKLKEKSQLVLKAPYSFDYMSDGSYISPTLRRAYAAVRDELPANHNPFDSMGPVGKFSRKNFLVGEAGGKYSYPGFKETKKHEGKLRAIYALMRITLRVVGPNRFYDLSKLLVYLSLYRKNRGLWKL